MDANYKYILKLLRRLFKNSGGTTKKTKEKDPKAPKQKKPRESKKVKPDWDKPVRKGPRHDVPDGREALKIRKERERQAWLKRELKRLNKKLTKKQNELAVLKDKLKRYYEKYPLDPGKVVKLKEARSNKLVNLVTAATTTYWNDKKKLAEVKKEIFKDFSKEEINIANNYLKLGWSEKDVYNLVATNVEDKKFASFGNNLGFTLKKFIKAYDKDYQLMLAKSVLQYHEKDLKDVINRVATRHVNKLVELSKEHPIDFPIHKEDIPYLIKKESELLLNEYTKLGKLKYPRFMIKEAKEYIRQYDLRGGPIVNEYYYKLKYGTQKWYMDSTVYQDMKKWEKEAGGAWKEHLNLLIKKYESKMDIQRWEVEYMKDYGSVKMQQKLAKLEKSMGFEWLLKEIKRDMPITAYKAISKEMKELYRKYDDLDVAYAIGKGRVKVSYEKLFSYIDEHYDHLLFNPGLAQSLEKSAAFFEAFFNRYGKLKGEFDNRAMSRANELYNRIAGMAHDNKLRLFDTSRLESVQNKIHEWTKLKAKGPTSVYSRTHQQQALAKILGPISKKSGIKHKKKK